MFRDSMLSYVYSELEYASDNGCVVTKHRFRNAGGKQVTTGVTNCYWVVKHGHPETGGLHGYPMDKIYTVTKDHRFESVATVDL
jgi:hypothetical protein